MARSVEGKLPATAYAVLGMLSLAPMSGYELTQNVDKTIAHFWTISKSQVYGELARLEELGLVEGTDVAQQGVPDKRTYELTAAGADALDGWLGAPTTEPHRQRSPQLLRMFFGHRFDRSDFEAFLDRYEADAARAREELEAIVELLSGKPETYYARATALVGLRNYEATIRAIDEIRSQIPKPRAKAVAREAFEEGARGMLNETPARKLRSKG